MHAAAAIILSERLRANLIEELVTLRSSAFPHPDLANVGRMARVRGAKAVPQVLSEVTHSDEIGSHLAFAVERLATTTRFFLDLVVTLAHARDFRKRAQESACGTSRLTWHAAWLFFWLLAVTATSSEWLHRLSLGDGLRSLDRTDLSTVSPIEVLSRYNAESSGIRRRILPISELVSLFCLD
jgi:hypothetical protein